MKKYDLLEKNLMEDLSKDEERRNTLGQLYATLDLADIYTFGFINFKKALTLYEKAGLLNEELKKRSLNKSRGEAEKEKEVRFYWTEGEFTYEREYDYQKISAEIENRKGRIQRLLGDAPRTAELTHEGRELGISKSGGYEIEDSMTQDVLDVSMFEDFEKSQYNSMIAHFRQRHTISASIKEFFINFNVARSLILSFPIWTLSKIQIQRIHSYAEKAHANSEEIQTLPPRAYLNFIKAVCFANLESFEKAIRAFTEFQAQVDQFNRETKEHLERLKEEREKERAKAISLATAMIAIDVVTMIVAGQAQMGGRPGMQTQLAGYGIPYLFKGVSFYQRQIDLIGESEYARNFNTILNMHEQLMLWDSMGYAYHQSGDLQKSVFYNKEAIQIINNMRSTISTEKQRISFARQKEAIFNRLIDDLAKIGDAEQAFSYSENARSRALIDLLGSRTDIQFKDKETTEYAVQTKEKQLYLSLLRGQTNISDEQAEYMNKLFRSASPTLPSPSPSSRQELDSLLTVSTKALKEIQSLLPSNATLLEFYVSDNAIYVWIVDSSASHLKKLDISPREVKELLKRFHRAILLYEIERNAPQPTHKTLSHALYKGIFSELEPYIKHNRIYVAAHRFLHFLPMESLHNGKEYLVNRFSFAYLPSASIFPFLKDKNKEFRNIFALGNPEVRYQTDLSPLPGAEQEVIEITRTYAHKKVLLKNEATETSFRANAPQYDIVHVASHGVLDPVDPMSSRLFLSQDDKNDGQLTAAELYGVQMNSFLVTLSACETGLSEIENGDELIGLLRGFFFAGTRSVVASLWKVHDEATMRLMASFYQHLREKGKFEALRMAKVDLLSQPDFSHPFYWAAFNLYGMGD